MTDWTPAGVVTETVIVDIPGIGLQGPQGATGAAGPTGPAGPQGPAGTGDITGVVAGHGLTGGGTSGDVTLALPEPLIAETFRASGAAAQLRLEDRNNSATGFLTYADSTYRVYSLSQAADRLTLSATGNMTLTGTATLGTPLAIASGGTNATTAATALANLGGAPLASPVFTGDARAVTPAAGDSDTSIATTAFVAAAVTPYANDVGRNLVHNPLFNIAQRGAGAFTAIGNTLDRWVLLFSTDTNSVSQVAALDAVRTAIGDEAVQFSLQNTFTGTAGAGAYSQLSHRMEKIQRLGGKTITVSFWAVGSAALKLGVSCYQFFGSGGSPSAGVQLNGQSVNLTTSWARYSATFTVPSTIGKVLGTNGDDWTQVQFWFSSGATNAVAAGSPGVQSGTVNLWGVQLEIGSVVATPLEKPDPAQDLAKCQRFYQTGTIYSAQVAAVSTTLGASVGLPVTMRAAPTITYGTNGNANYTIVGNFVFTNNAGVGIYGTAPAGGGLTINQNFTASADL